MTPWLPKAFDRPVTDPPWFEQEPDDDADRLDDLGWFRALMEVLLHLPRVAHRYSDEQLAQGLRYMASPRSSSMFGYRVAEEHERVSFALRSAELYRSVFANRCSHTLGHLNEPGDALNDACYMWFDWLSDAFIDFEGFSGPFAGQEALLDACSQILELGHPACEEGALHGLGHLAEYYPKEVRAVVGEYLARTQGSSTRNELQQYAFRASSGNVL